MAEHAAVVRLTLADRGFASSFDRAAGQVEARSTRMGQSMGAAMSNGIKGGMDALSSLGSRVKDFALSAGGLIGGLGIAGLSKGAVDADEKFRALNFTMGAGAGVFQHHADVQRQAHAVAKQYALSSVDLADALKTVFDATGDAEFARSTMADIGVAAAASHKPVGQLAPLVAAMNEQFKIGPGEIRNTLAAVLSLGARGGLTVEEMADSLGRMGRTAGVAGLEGEGGLRKLLAMANMVSDATGTTRGSISAVQAIFTSMVGSADKVKQLKLMGIDTKDKDAIELLGEVLGKTKGDPQKLTKIFGDQGLTIAQAFGGLKDFKGAIEQASKASLTASDLEKRAGEETKAPAAGVRKALEILEQSFRSPKMMAAIQDLAQHLPALAEGVADLVGVVVDNPALAAGGLVGGTIMKGALGAMLQQAITQGGTIAGGTMSQSIATGGGLAAGAIGLAMAAAVIGIGAAVEQAFKLKQDLKQRDKDVADRIKNNEEIAKRQGVEPEPIERLAWEEGGWMQENLLADKHHTRKHADKGYKTSQLGKADPVMDDWMDTFADQRGGALAPAPPPPMSKDEMRMMRDLQSFRPEAAGGKMARPTSGVGSDDAAGKAAAQQLASKELAQQMRAAAKASQGVDTTLKSRPTFLIGNWDQMPKDAKGPR